jgi:hypothetical protein
LETQLSEVVVQSTQLAPPVPQAVSLPPVRQVLLLSQQPEQLVLAQVPPQPSSSPAHFSVQLGTQVQAPWLQVNDDWEQLTQPSPPVPQAALLVPL